MVTRGFIFSADMAMFIGLLALASILVAHASAAIMDTVSSQNVIFQLRSSAEHAINVLLFTLDAPYRCKFGENNVTVPACVWRGSGTVDSGWFFPDRRVECNVTTTNTDATRYIGKIMDCQSIPPRDVNTTLLIVPFSFCWANDGRGSTKNRQSNIRKCTWIEANLIVWT